jgi:hypothetical protein
MRGPTTVGTRPAVRMAGRHSAAPSTLSATSVTTALKAQGSKAPECPAHRLFSLLLAFAFR